MFGLTFKMPTNTHIPVLGFNSWLPVAEPSFLLVQTLGGSGCGSSSWILATHGRGLNLCPAPTLA